MQVAPFLQGLFKHGETREHVDPKYPEGHVHVGMLLELIEQIPWFKHGDEKQAFKSFQNKSKIEEK